MVLRDKLKALAANGGGAAPSTAASSTAASSTAAPSTAAVAASKPSSSAVRAKADDSDDEPIPLPPKSAAPVVAAKGPPPASASGASDALSPRMTIDDNDDGDSADSAYVARWPFAPQNKGELALLEGDLISVTTRQVRARRRVVEEKKKTHGLVFFSGRATGGKALRRDW